ncbi:MAG: M48 family metalloprotease [Candidatus Wallbacteria bacterium]|nr:M48 family metalloprotease [Candidatus Wallbacteria bacterium]
MRGTWRLLGRVLVESLSSQELAGILGHELGHLERRDPLLRPLLAAAGAVAGFVPGVAHALGRWALEAEKACDRRGVAAGVPARVMARALEKSHSICTATRTGLLPALSAFRSGLGQRVEALVDHRTLSSRRLRTAAALFLAAGTFASRIGVW